MRVLCLWLVDNTDADEVPLGVRNDEGAADEPARRRAPRAQLLSCSFLRYPWCWHPVPKADRALG